MAAIAKVKVEGFQSHVESVFNLENGLNVITGPSDSGKTAFIRAVRWVAFNEPQGEAFVNEKVGEAVVAIYLDNGAIITKRRRKGKTSYLLQQSEDGEGSLYEKSEVPEEVKHLLQIEKQTFGDFETALNFAFQLDAPFLISETPSAGAKILGKLAGTESVDLAIKGVSKDTYGTRQERTNADKDIERIAGAMLAYHTIDDAKEAVDLAEMLLEQIEVSHKKFEDLKQYRNMFEAFTAQVKGYGEALDKLAHVPALEEDLRNIEKAQQRYDSLLQLYSQYSQLQKRIELLGNQLERYYGIEEAVNLVDSLAIMSDKLSLLNILRTEYQKYTEELRKNYLVLEKTENLPAANDLLQIISWRLDQLNDLKIYNLEFVSTHRRAQEATERVKAFEGLTEAEAILNEAGGEIEGLQLLKNLSADYYRKVADFDAASLQLRMAESDIRYTQEKLSEAWEAAGGICPLCEQPHERGAC
ncbi:AAA family ATPase [Cytobacillus praedii]|uniref:AAA family ATPase n=1 Tax=Cytobacillus praedii TaxID=1742358 RepID=UPI002E1C0EC6|nr:AAA family ATPase [Cytobacillus praedii]MED3571917.1 AAA family ATPase [Cytobacillus praedii]